MKREPVIARSAGLSLIELMIGMLLGALLIAGAGAAYLAAKRSYTEVEQVSSLTENAEFAEQILSEAVMHAGFYGEVSAGKIEPDINLTAVTDDCTTTQAAAYNLNNYIFAAAVAADGTALGCIDHAKLNSDVLVIKRVMPRPYIDTPTGGAGSAGNGTIDAPALRAGTTYIMTNNVLGILFDGSDTAPTILAGGAVPEGKAWAYLFEIYYVRDPDPLSEKDIPQLARKVLALSGGAMTVVSEDVIEGVEDMRILLGVDGNDDGNVDLYTNAAGVGGKWDNIASVELFLLVRSATEDMQFTDTKTYSLGGVNSYTPPAGDAQKYRRLLVHTSTSLRNPKLIIRGSAE